MLILGIETSCDETAASVVEDGVKIHSNIIASSIELHKKTGGIIPERAAREQIKCIIPVIKEALGDFTSDKIDAIAVTYGPGLIGSLLVGVETAKTLAYVWKKPIIPVNHLVGHIYANFVERQKAKGKRDKLKVETKDERSKTKDQIRFPAMVLIVSGGHTELVLMRNHEVFQYVGGTRDDAAGEALDKTARLLGLPYPGGPSIQKAAEIYQQKIKDQNAKIKTTTQNSKLFLPRPMINSKNLDFSFSGLKTAVLNMVKGKQSTSELINALAYETQEAICDVLVEKTIKAAGKYNVKSILLAGGVTANKRLRKKIQKKLIDIDSGLRRNDKESGIKFILSIPPIELCTDNAVCIASAGFFNYYPTNLKKITVEPGLEIN